MNKSQREKYKRTNWERHEIVHVTGMDYKHLDTQGKSEKYLCEIGKSKNEIVNYINK